MEDCIMCVLYEGFQTQLMEFAVRVFQTLGHELASLTRKFFVLWAVWHFVINGYFNFNKDPLDVPRLIKEFFFMTFIVVIFQSSGDWWFDMLLLPLNACTAVAILMYESVSGENLSGNGIVGLINAIETGSLGMFRETISSMFSDVGFRMIKNIGYLLLFTIAFLYMTWEMMKQITVSLSKYMLVVILFPLIVCISILPALRKTLFNSIRVFIVSGFEILAAVVFSVLAIAMNKNILQLSPYENLGADVPQSEFYDSDSYWTVIITMLILGLVYRQIMEVVNQFLEVSVDASFRKGLGESKITKGTAEAGKATIKAGATKIRAKFGSKG